MKFSYELRPTKIAVTDFFPSLLILIYVGLVQIGSSRVLDCQWFLIECHNENSQRNEKNYGLRLFVMGKFCKIVKERSNFRSYRSAEY